MRRRLAWAAFWLLGVVAVAVLIWWLTARGFFCHGSCLDLS